MDDSELVRRAAGGERQAWAEVWDRYGPGLHRYARRLVDNDHDAGDVVADTFVSAAEHLGELREAERLRPWLYAICRRHAQRRWEGRDRVRPVDDDVLTAVVESRGGEVSAPSGTDAAEAAELVWAAAEGMGQADRDLLALVLSADLESGAVADITGDTPAAVYVKVSRLKDSLGRAAGALLVARHHRNGCDDLQGVLADWDGGFSPLWRKRIARHVDQCDVCGDARRAAAGALFSLAGGAPLLLLPDALRDRAVDGAVAATPVSSSTAWDPTADGPADQSRVVRRSGPVQPSPVAADSRDSRGRKAHAPLAFGPDGWPVPQPWELGRARRRAPLLALAAGLVLLTTVGVVAAQDDEPTLPAGQVAAATRAPSASPPTTAPASTTPTSAPTPSLPAPSIPAPATAAPAPGPSATEPAPSPPPTPPRTQPPTTAAPPVVAPPRITLDLADTSLDTACGAQTTTEAVARAADGSGPVAVRISWDGTAPADRGFTGRGPHTTTVGPFSSVDDADGTDTVTVRATATDALGRTATVTRTLTVSVAPC